MAVRRSGVSFAEHVAPADHAHYRGYHHGSQRDPMRLPFEASFDLVDPGERVGQPLRRGSTMIGALAWIVTLTGVAYGLAATQDVWRPWTDDPLRRAAAAIAGALHAASPNPAANATPALATADMSPPPLLTPAMSAPEVAASPPEAVAYADTPREVDPPVASDQPIDAEATPEPLPAPDTRDAIEARALAAGLHPGISKSLLTRLTDADFENARIAVTRALAETPANAAFTWPRIAGSGAQFRVHFVKGAGPHCRRYVVAVTLERWSTTALPLERCRE